MIVFVIDEKDLLKTGVTELKVQLPSLVLSIEDGKIESKNYVVRGSKLSNGLSCKRSIRRKFRFEK